MLFDLEVGAQDDVERFDSGLHQQAVYAIQQLVQDASASVSEVKVVCRQRMMPALHTCPHTVTSASPKRF
jgi:hypothetical protein